MEYSGIHLVRIEVENFKFGGSTTIPDRASHHHRTKWEWEVKLWRRIVRARLNLPPLRASNVSELIFNGEIVPRNICRPSFQQHSEVGGRYG